MSEKPMPADDHDLHVLLYQPVERSLVKRL